MNSDIIRKVCVYLMAYAVIVFGPILVISFDNKDFATTFSSVMATMNNIGPGIGQVGPSGNFSEFSILSKLMFCIDMLAGRLELFPFLMLFTASAWKKHF